jgi:diguanylate cyclase (GGDEF)-like protein
MTQFAQQLLPPAHVLAEQLRMSYRQLPAALRLGVILAVGLCWLFYGVIPENIMFGWLAAIIIFSLVRFLSLKQIATEQFSEEQAVHYARLYSVTAFLLGSTWASVAFLLPYVGNEDRILIFVLLIAISGGALTTTAAHVISFYSYTFPIMGAYAAHAFVLEERMWLLVGLLTVIYMLYMTIAAWKLYISLQETIILRYKWQETADSLDRVKQELNTELISRKNAEKRLTKVMVELERAVNNLEELAAIDELTGIPNRRSFDAAIAREWSRARREHSSIALLMIDVDYFKKYNDLYHHQKGDETLRSVARILGQYAQRPGDMAARYGGEEFALILVNSSEEHVNRLAEQLRRNVRELQIVHEGSESGGYLTVSIGTAISNDPGDDDYTALISAADHALYEAKNAGRNQVKSAQA